jgi:hypothetical protein
MLAAASPGTPSLAAFCPPKCPRDDLLMTSKSQALKYPNTFATAPPLGCIPRRTGQYQQQGDALSRCSSTAADHAANADSRRLDYRFCRRRDGADVSFSSSSGRKRLTFLTAALTPRSARLAECAQGGSLRQLPLYLDLRRSAR